jgi:predicted dehydrogenase
VFHAPFLELHEGFELVGAWERSTKRIQQSYSNTTSYPTLEALLNDDTIQLVVVNTPVATHYEYAKKALLAGKHLIVEKAFTTTVAEAEELVALAREKGLKLAVFQNRRWDSDFKTVQKIVQEGSLGALVEAEFHFDRYNPNLSPKQHKETPNAGAGILKDLGPHLIDQALCLFGMPKTVTAAIRTRRPNSVVDDYIDIQLDYGSFLARLKASFFVREAVVAYQLHGQKGSFLKARGDVQEDTLKTGAKPSQTNWGIEPIALEGELHTELDTGVVRKKVPTLAGNYYDFFDAVYQSICNDAPEPVSGADGLRVMQVIEAALHSNRLQQTIVI